MRNTLGDLNNHLFMQIERLNDEELNGEQLLEELKRSKAIADVAGKIIENGKLVLDSQKFMDERANTKSSVPKMLEG